MKDFFEYSKLGFVYKITSPTGKIYIGITKDPKYRAKMYRLLFCKKQTKIYRSIIKHGWDNHVFEIIKTIPYDRDNLYKLESFYVKLFGTFNSNTGMNLTSGGLSTKMSDETKVKIRKNNTGRIISPETREKLRQHNLGKKQSAETIEKRRPKLLGKKRSPETCKRISEVRTGMKFSESHKQAIRNRPPILWSDARKERARLQMTGKKMPQLLGNTKKGKYVIDIVTGQEFRGLTTACKIYGYNYGTIKAQMRGRYPHTTNLRWKNESAA